jgi:integrase
VKPKGDGSGGGASCAILSNPDFRMRWMVLQLGRGEYHDNDFVIAKPDGAPYRRDVMSTNFGQLIRHLEMPHIRFHDLRHSCALLLLANGVPMNQIQEWLGHSAFSATANIYAHLDYNSKLDSAQAMVQGLSGALAGVAP